MAKNSNKTEHVLKLITNSEDNAAPAKAEVPEASETPEPAAIQSQPLEQEILPPSEKSRGPAQDDDKIVVKNIVESFVEEKLSEVLDRIKCCRCDSCLNDVRAIALNSLPPRYIATRKGELFSKASACYTQYEADVISAITRAAVVVATRPRHH